MKTLLHDLDDSVARVAASPLAPAPDARVFLFLQGLPGPFFARLAAELAAGGAAVRRINFNGGDHADWPLPGAMAYRGTLSGWRDFFGQQLADRRVTDVVMFNDARPLHAEARQVCLAHGIAVHVFEDGYLRPDFITLERGGINRNSPLSRSLAEIRRTARNLAPAPPVSAVPASFRRRALDGVRYELFTALLRPRFRGYRSHRPLSPLTEGRGWLRRLLRMKGEDRRTAEALASIAGRRCFLLPLQLDADTQLRLYSVYGGMAPALAEIVDSFARRAPADSVLIVKQHPLDPALIDWRQRCADLAQRHGIGDRLVFIERGDVGAILQGCAGLVTINSTTGMMALENSVPVFVLGHAVYGIDGIVAAGTLDAFWRDPGRVDADAYQALRTVMRHHSLVHGGFHSDTGIDLAVRNAAARLLAGT